MTVAAALPDSLRRALGGIEVRSDDDALVRHGTDWTGRFRGRPTAVAFPASTPDVVRVVRQCHEHGLPVVAQGGNTGLVGGAVAPRGGVVVSTRHLLGLGPVDLAGWSVRAGAGVTLEALHEHVGAAGVRFGVDFAARGTATVGGAIATNAGGAHVLRHGMMRHQVLGVEAVLADGRVVRRLHGLRKDNTGFDLAGLLCGSEGTLGIVTGAQLRVLPAPRAIATAIVGLADLAGVVPALGHARTRLADLEAAELVLGDTLEAVCRHASLPAPLQTACPAHLLLQVGSQADPMAALLETIDSMPGVVDATVGEGAAAGRRLWAYRELVPEVMGHCSVTPVVKVDVSVPLVALPELVRRVHRVVADRDPEVVAHVFGHAGDGNVHVNLLDVPAADGEGLEAAVLAHAIELGGAVSGEHGIGTAKLGWLARDRTADELATMTAIKRALDPDGVMNPGVLLPVTTPESPDGR